MIGIVYRLHNDSDPSIVCYIDRARFRRHTVGLHQSDRVDLQCSQWC